MEHFLVVRSVGLPLYIIITYEQKSIAKDLGLESAISTIRKNSELINIFLQVFILFVHLRRADHGEKDSRLHGVFSILFV